MNYLYGAIAILIALLGIEQYGEHRVQIRWDAETARLRTLADQQKRQDKEITQILEAQHQKDIEYAKTQAAKSAIAAYLKSHGLLPDGTSLRCADGGKVPGSKIPDESSGQSGIGSSLEEFAGRCAKDALTIIEWHEWATRENLPIGD